MVFITFLQFLLGNIHLFTIVLAIAAYFSRNDQLTVAASQGLRLFSSLSMLVGGIMIGRGNIYAAGGAALVLAGQYSTRYGHGQHLLTIFLMILIMSSDLVMLWTFLIMPLLLLTTFSSKVTKYLQK